MSESAGGHVDPFVGFRIQLAARLRERSSEIEDAIFARVQALSDPAGEEDSDYVGGLREAVAESVEFALMSIEQGEGWSDPIPKATSEQVRRAARSDVGLDMVLRRYLAGDRLLREFIMDRADHLPNHALRQILTTQDSQLDRLLGFVATEYVREQERTMRSPARRLTESVGRLLASVDPGDAGDLAYEFSAWHLGLIAKGAKAYRAVRSIAAALDRQLLAVRQGDGLVWAWFGGGREFRTAEVEHNLLAATPEDVYLAVGEPRWGIQGWRLTHHEAQAALQVMLRRPQRLTRGSNVLLLAAVLENEALTESLFENYLAPLDHARDSGRVLRETLRAYFDADCNAATAAAALEVNRHTVRRRLQKIEKALDKLLPVCRAELEVALRLEELWLSPAFVGSPMSNGSAPKAPISSS